VLVHALDAEAEALGLRVGQNVTDARAAIPHLAVIEADLDADAALLASIADWADRYTPLVGFAPPDGLLLDITGCAHLFGGEAGLLADLLGRLRGLGIEPCAAIADTAGAAAALARFGDGHTIVPPGGARAAVAPLPLAALRLEAPLVAALARTGLKRVGDLLGMPRAPLAARFGKILLTRLDQALGLMDEAISPRLPLPALLAERRFAEPIAGLDDVLAATQSLAATLGDSLARRGEGARLMELALFRVDGAVSRARVGTGRPLRDPALMASLFAERLGRMGDDLDAGFGWDLVRLSVVESAPEDARQIDLAGRAAAEADIAELVDRLGARLGLGAVGRLVARDTHRPEAAAAVRPAAAPLAPAHPWLDIDPEDGPIARPLRLFPVPEAVEAVAEVPDGPPVRFRWRRTLYAVARAEGPERIAAEWWRSDEPTRDYYRVEDETGRRFWIFRAGLFGLELAEPRWFVHGLFA